MSTVSISEASRNLSHWINRASYGQEYVVLTSRGKPKAVLVGIDVFTELMAHQQEIGQKAGGETSRKLQDTFGIWQDNDDQGVDSAKLVQEMRSEWKEREGRIGH